MVSNIFLCLPLLGEMIQSDEHLFQMGWFNHQLDTFRPFGFKLNPQVLQITNPRSMLRLESGIAEIAWWGEGGCEVGETLPVVYKWGYN